MGSCACNTGGDFKGLDHWIGLREDLQENMTFDVKNDGNTIEKPWKYYRKAMENRWKTMENTGKLWKSHIMFSGDVPVPIQ